MTLRYRHYSPELDPDACISVDGNAPGRLNLSHWPGNRTPSRFKHDLSTGACLKLLQEKDRDVLRGFTTVTNNHWDTDGCCSAFALIQPGVALVQGHHLIAAALAGDFELFTTPEGVKIDLTLTALTQHPASSVHSDRFTDERARRQAQYDHGLALLPSLLANPDLHADWFAREYWTIQRDLRALREDLHHVERFDALDLSVVRADQPLHRTAVNTAAGTDRVLTLTSHPQGGVTAELRLTTLSWFELVAQPKRTRVDWSPLLSRLTEEFAAAGGHWQADDLADPTPRLAFVGDSGDLAPHPAGADRLQAAVARFFASHPLRPAGI
ncbi:MAG: hypothetical protein IT463_00855 [Planctomycetes bacterium]|nr:hypothetical protein [Planctomycetota bacterium]